MKPQETPQVAEEGPYLSQGGQDDEPHQDEAGVMDAVEGNEREEIHLVAVHGRVVCQEYRRQRRGAEQEPSENRSER
jgi:hypothetical protein